MKSTRAGGTSQWGLGEGRERGDQLVTPRGSGKCCRFRSEAVWMCSVSQPRECRYVFFPYFYVFPFVINPPNFLIYLPENVDISIRYLPRARLSPTIVNPRIHFYLNFQHIRPSQLPKKVFRIQSFDKRCVHICLQTCKVQRYVLFVLLLFKIRFSLRKSLVRNLFFVDENFERKKRTFDPDHMYLSIFALWTQKKGFLSFPESTIPSMQIVIYKSNITSSLNQQNFDTALVFAYRVTIGVRTRSYTYISRCLYT